MSLAKYPGKHGVYISPHAGPVASITVGTAREDGLSEIDFEVVCGQYYVGPVTKLKIANVQSLPASMLPKKWRQGVRITCFPFRDSILSLPKRCLNWQGDLVFFIPPVAASGAAFLFVAAFMKLGQAILKRRTNDELPESAGVSKCDVSPASPSISGVIKWICGLLLSVVVLQQSILQIDLFIIGLDALQYGLSLIVVISIFAASILLGWYVSQKPEDRHRFVYALAVTVLFLIALKSIWILKNPAVQINDYAIYWSNACRMAEGDWASLPNASPINKTYVQRSFLYFYPLVAIFGPDPENVAWCNLVVQTFTVILVTIFARKAIGSTAAIATMPLLVAFPDFWFGLTIASHDVPAMFLLAVFFLFADRVFFSGKSRWTPAPLNVAVQILYAALLGVVSGLLEIQRSYWPILFVSVVVFGGKVAMSGFLQTDLRRGERVFRGLMPIGLASVVILLMFSTSSYISDRIESRTGKLGSSSALGYVSGIDSGTNAKWNDIAPWSHKYFPAIPDGLKFQAALRRLVNEKLLRWDDFFVHLFRKNIQFAGFDYTMYHAVRQEFSVHCWEDRIRWFEARRVYCSLMGFILGSCFLVRLAVSSLVRFGHGEWLLLGFSFCGILIELLLTEAVAVYDIFFGFLYCFAVGRLIECWAGTGRCESLGVCLRSQRYCCFLALSFIATLLCLHIAVGSSLGRVFSAFSRFSSVAPVKSDLAGQIDASLLEDGVSFSATLTKCRSEGEDSLSWVGASAILECPSGLSFKGGFLLTGDHRRNKQPFEDEWQGLPVKYELRVNSLLISSGPLADLNTPRFISADDSWKVQSGELIIDIRLISTADWEAVSSVRAPAIAIEFPFFFH